MAKYGKKVGTLPGVAVEKVIEGQKKGKFGKKLTLEEAAVEISRPEGFVSGELERRHQPTRLEKLLPGGQAFAEMRRPKIPKKIGSISIPFGGEPIPWPTSMRAVGEAIDIPIDVAMNLPEAMRKAGEYQAKFRAGQTSLKEGLAGPMKVGKGILSSLATTVTHPFASFRERPIETAADVYAGTQLVKGGVALGGMAKRGVKAGWSKVFPKRTYKSIGEDLSQGIKEVDKLAGKAVGAEKEALKGIKEPVDVRPALQRLQAERAKLFDSSGKLQTSQANLDAIDDIIDDLKSGVVSADDLIKVKSKIYDDYVSFGKPGQPIPKVSANTERILLQGADDINNGIGQLADKYGASQWKATNAQFKRIRDLRVRLGQKLGTDQTNLSSRMKTIGNKIAAGDESYLELFNDIQKEIGYLKPEYASAIRDLEKMTLTERGMQKMATGSILGTTPRMLGGAKDIAKAKLMGGADIAKSAYLGPRLFGKQLPGIKQVPFSPGLAGATLLSKSGYTK